MNNWKQMFTKLAEQKGLEFQQEEKDNNSFWIGYFYEKENLMACGHFRVKSWKHAWTLLINGYLGV